MKNAIHTSLLLVSLTLLFSCQGEDSLPVQLPDDHDLITFTVDVKNTGSVAGKESVLLFSSDLVASLTPDNRRLRNFEKVALQPGETKRVTLRIKGSDLAFVGYDGKWTLEAGDFRIQVGDQVLNITCTATKKWSEPNK